MIGAERTRLEDARKVVRGESTKPVTDIVNLLRSPALPGDDVAPAVPKGVATLVELREAANDARSTARLLRRLLDKPSFRALLVATALVVLIGVSVVAAGGANLLARAISTVVVVPTVAGAANVAWRRFRDVEDVTSQAEELERWIDGQWRRSSRRRGGRRGTATTPSAGRSTPQPRIRAVRPGDLVREYVESRVTNDAYRDQLGVISLVPARRGRRCAGHDRRPKRMGGHADRLPREDHPDPRCRCPR